jgi:hypothetical protein
LAPAARGVLERLRRRIRQYVWAEGIAAAVAWVGAAFWLSLAIDWFFEPPAEVRGLLLAGAVLGLAVVLFRMILRRAFVPLSDSSMALVLERRFPQLDDSLATAVDLANDRHEADECDERMLARTCDEAESRIGEVSIGQVFDFAPLRRMFSAALLLTAAIGLFAATQPEAFGVWARRSLMMSDELWPRHTRLSVEGFSDGKVKIARGADLEIIARADTTMPVVPQVVHVYYRTAEGAHGRQPMSREGTAEPGEDPFQHYSHTFRGVLSPIEFDVVGGDDRIDDLRIEVVDSPTIIETTLDCRFPEYTGRPPRTLPVSGVVQLPLGTEVVLRAKTNKPLVRVQIDSALDEEIGEVDTLGADALLPGAEGFSYPLGELTEDRTLLLTLHDTDGIESREPIRLALATVADRPPEVIAELRGIGSAITPEANLPVAGKVTDDYGIAESWFETAVGKGEPRRQVIARTDGNPTELLLDEALDARALELTPGQKLILGVKAHDRYALGAGPNEGASQRWLLDVVTADQLRAILESRELVLRQRFETIIADVTETRDSILRVRFETPEEAAAETDENDGSEPGDTERAPSDSGETAEERLAGLNALRVQRALQNSRKSAHETRATADSFDDIRLQLVNNRIDTEELNQRLEEGIADPLRNVSDEMFPELERRLQRLLETLADDEAGTENRRAAIEQSNLVLARLKLVLDRMLELENFNEVIELLRSIIREQEQLREQTEKRHKQQLRDLLED